MTPGPEHLSDERARAVFEDEMRAETVWLGRPKRSALHAGAGPWTQIHESDVSEYAADPAREWGRFVRADTAGPVDALLATEVKCPRCVGTGELESSDSTEDGWWDCGSCKGTGKRTFADAYPQAADVVREHLAPAASPVLSPPDGDQWLILNGEGIHGLLQSGMVEREERVTSMLRRLEDAATAAGATPVELILHERGPRDGAADSGAPQVLEVKRTPWGTLVEDLGCPHCGKTCDVCWTYDEELHLLRQEVLELRPRVHRSHEDVVMAALDEAPDARIIVRRIIDWLDQHRASGSAAEISTPAEPPGPSQQAPADAGAIQENDPSRLSPKEARELLARMPKDPMTPSVKEIVAKLRALAQSGGAA